MSAHYTSDMTNCLKIETHSYAIALHLLYYNFVRVDQTLNVTPAMEAGITDRAWDITDILALIDSDQEAQETAILPKKPISS